MKYLIIDGYSVNSDKGFIVFQGRKVTNDFKSTHGKEVDTVLLNTSLIGTRRIDDSIIGKTLNVEFNKQGRVSSLLGIE